MLLAWLQERTAEVVIKLERKPPTERDDGFTLIELLIVIVVLAVLAGIVVFAVGGLGDRGTTSACERDRRTLASALEVHRVRDDGYPATLTELTSKQYLRADASVTATQKSGVGYTLDYLGNGELTDCAAALAAGGTPVGGGSGGGGSDGGGGENGGGGESPPAVLGAPIGLSMTSCTASRSGNNNTAAAALSWTPGANATAHVVTGGTSGTQTLSGSATGASVTMGSGTTTFTVTATSGTQSASATVSAVVNTGNPATCTPQ